ncbi:SPOR domain-containing protein [Erythrobacter sp. NE805]|uniref:SPOR domain-containing protein n=1 Tax=Erythrobacter sp. NE805 TaxID=3389875 RepID=UPI00396B3193
MIEAEYEDIPEDGGELDLADTDSLPWLESDEEDEEAGGIDTWQIVGFVGLLLALGAAVVGGVWFFSNRMAASEVVADGSVIEAPEGPIKQRPENPGGKEFAGTGNVAPVVGEGGQRPAVVAETPPLPSVPGAAPSPTPAKGAPGSKLVPVTAPSAAPAPAVPGTGVQLAAYGTRARAEQGWSDIARRTEVLKGVKYRIVEGKVDIGTVYRLQAVAGSRAEATRLCAALKADGIDCQVK